MKRQSDELAEKMPKTLPQVRPGTAMSAQALAEAAKLLNEKQRSVADARCAVVAAVLGIKYQYGCSAKAAVAQFLGLLAEGKLDAVTLGNLEKANDRSRSAKVGERTLDGWISAYLKAENAKSFLLTIISQCRSMPVNKYLLRLVADVYAVSQYPVSAETGTQLPPVCAVGGSGKYAGQ